jgi:DNA-directed RNA polymerase subunit RPC12/RpoP
MRALVEPPPSSRCNFCGGQLLLKRIEVANRTLNLDNQIFVCANCGRETSYRLAHDHNTPHSKVA